MSIPRKSAQWLIHFNLLVRYLQKPLGSSPVFVSKESKTALLLCNKKFLHDLRFRKTYTAVGVIRRSIQSCTMSGGEESEPETKNFFAERAKTGRSTCKKCKQKVEAGVLRLGKAGYNAFGPGPMKMWYHPECLFEVFSRQRPTTARINGPDDIEGWDNLDEEDKRAILKFLPDIGEDALKNVGGSGTSPKKRSAESEAGPSRKVKKSDTQQKDAWAGIPGHKDNSLEEFTRLLTHLKAENTYTGKTAIIRNFLEKGTDRDKFKGDVRLWVKLLLPGVIQRVYNLGNLQLVKLFSKIFHVDHESMLELLEQGDIAETIGTSFTTSNHVKPASTSTLTLQEVNSFLDSLTKLTRETDQEDLLAKLTKRCTIDDLKAIICLIKGDLRINAGTKHVLGAVHPDAHAAFMTTRDIDKVLAEAMKKRGSALTMELEVLKGVQPMLAEPCKSVEYALKKFPRGMYAEIKYDGERVQVHKQGTTFKYFSRALKPVSPDKVNLFKDYIPQAFPSGDELILDSEILLIDTNTGKPLPFGTLGVHKRQAFKESSVCLFVFDCLHFNGTSLLNKPLKERRKILYEVMTEIPNHIMFSETEEIYNPKQLQTKITKVFQLGLEGVVLKGFESIYEPNKRRWLKVKKDYLNDGAMADSADLVVLGAWYGTGQRGGMMSIFLMGCWNPMRKVWIPVTNVATGLDQKTLNRIQSELKMTKISKNPNLIPNWLQGPKKVVPDFIATNPKEMPVWEITGAEFSQTEDGISIRFPRVKRFRDDKTWETATNLPELQALYKKSKETTTFNLPSSSSDEQPKEKPDNSPEDKDKLQKPPDSNKITNFVFKKPYPVTSRAITETCKKEGKKPETSKDLIKKDKKVEHRQTKESTSTEDKVSCASTSTKPKLRIPGYDMQITSRQVVNKEFTLTEDKVSCASTSSTSTKPKLRIPGYDMQITSRHVANESISTEDKVSCASTSSTSTQAKVQIPGYDMHLMSTCVMNMRNEPYGRIFEGCTVYLLREHRPRFAPWLLLCGGSLVQDGEYDTATHVMYARHKVTYTETLFKIWSPKAQHVHRSWIIDSVVRGVRQDIERYAVILTLAPETDTVSLDPSV